jgi:protein-disulfide isomerase
VCLLLCAIGCAQSNAPAVPADVNERIQRQVRAYFNIPPDVDIKVGTLGPSEFPGYDTVPVTMSREGKTQKADFLLAKDGKTLFRLTKIDLTKDIFAENMGKITLADRPVRGNPDAKVTVVSFDDFECPFCSRMHATLMNDILPAYGDKVRIIYKDYPLPQQMHPWAQRAAIDANCLAKESGTAYWQLADYLHANQRAIPASPQTLPASDAELDRLTLDFGKKNGANADRLQACIKAQADSVVKASVAEGDKLGVSATPTLFINGEKIEGALDADTVRAALNRQLLAQGIQPPPPPAKPAAPAPAAPPNGAKPSPSTAPTQPGAGSNSGSPSASGSAPAPLQPASK